MPPRRRRIPRGPRSRPSSSSPPRLALRRFRRGRRSARLLPARRPHRARARRRGGVPAPNRAWRVLRDPESRAAYDPAERLRFAILSKPPLRRRAALQERAPGPPLRLFVDEGLCIGCRGCPGSPQHFQDARRLQRRSRGRPVGGPRGRPRRRRRVLPQDCIHTVPKADLPCWSGSTPRNPGRGSPCALWRA